MADCIVFPVLNSVQAVAAAEPVAEVEGASAEGFTLDDIIPEDPLPEPCEPDGMAADIPVRDPLQMLIEDMSGISGALREAGGTLSDRPPPPVEADPAALDTQDMTVRVAAPAPSETVPVDAALADPVRLDAAILETETMPGDSIAASATAAAPDDTVAPAESRAKVAIVPIVRQIADAVVTASEDRIEIALAPEELGRIRMVMSSADHNPHVIIWVERPEVLDQLRRNAAFLQECLSDAGMADASLEFHGGTSSGSQGDQPTSATPDRPAFETAEPVHLIPLAWTSMAIPARLDIRI